MRKIQAFVVTAIAIGAAGLAAPATSQAQSGASLRPGTVASAPVTQPAQDFSAQQRRPRTITPRTYTPRPTPRSNNAPPYIYPGSRNALDTCAFC